MQTTEIYQNLSSTDATGLTLALHENSTRLPITLKTYDYSPLSTIIALCFVGIWFFSIAILKIMYRSTDQFMNNNKYDLVLFKPPNPKNNVIVGRKMFENNAVIQHNLKAEQESNFDIRVLEKPKAFSMLKKSNQKI